MREILNQMHERLDPANGVVSVAYCMGGCGYIDPAGVPPESDAHQLPNGAMCPGPAIVVTHNPLAVLDTALDGPRQRDIATCTRCQQTTTIKLDGETGPRERSLTVEGEGETFVWCLRCLGAALASVGVTLLEVGGYRMPWLGPLTTSADGATVTP